MCCQVKRSERKCQLFLSLKHYLIHFEIYKAQKLWDKSLFFPLTCFEPMISATKIAFLVLDEAGQGCWVGGRAWHFSFHGDCILSKGNSELCPKGHPFFPKQLIYEWLRKKEKSQNFPWILRQTAWVFPLNLFHLPRFRYMEPEISTLSSAKWAPEFPSCILLSWKLVDLAGSSCSESCNDWKIK